MAKTIHPSIPGELILSELKKKTQNNERQSEFLSLFESFSRLVAHETRFIVALFPEYTPHDEPLHLRRLFELAECLLGEIVIKNLNATELFILALSLYGHDWGMAVSDKEKEVILSGSSHSDDFALLENEQNKFEQHLIDQNQLRENLSNFGWQEYVRKTHAERSARRCIKYFKNIDNGIGEALARACEGHWLDFEELRNLIIYPYNYSIRGEVINLRAIAIYVRLIDLFDITNERTPYSIYKYTAPKDVRSVMEWAKHRAINSMSTVPSQNGRNILVDGQTTDHEVFAALLDLKSFCAHQLKEGLELLDEMHLEKYNLHIYDLKWNIIPKGFDPINIRFQFDRSRMFEILSDEIYQGDKYVFIRELIQNSVDAMKFRTELLSTRMGYRQGLMSRVKICVEELDDDQTLVSVTDDGIGMDRYVIENYLSVAGRSYYRSEEFQKLGLKMDPISRFGVGILSCFMVAERIEIISYRDRLVKHDSKVIKIQVPFVDQQFRVEMRNPENHDRVGTTVKVYVSAKKILKNLHDEKPLQVTDYVRAIAGAVDFPIEIIERGNKSVVVSPWADFDEISQTFPEHHLHAIDTHLRIDNMFAIQNIKNAKLNFKEHRIDVSKDLNIENVEGYISYLIPLDFDIRLVNSGRSWPGDDFTIKDSGKRRQEKRLQFSFKWRNSRNNQLPEDWNLGRSAFSQMTYQIFLDGILVSGALSPREIDGKLPKQYFSSRGGHFFTDEHFVVPRVILNLIKDRGGKTDLSRFSLENRSSHWEDIVVDKLHLFLLKYYEDLLKSKDGMQLLVLMSQMEFFYRLSVDQIIDFIGLENCPVAMIKTNGTILFEDWGNLIDRQILLQPKYTNWFSRKLINKFNNEDSTSNNYSQNDFLLDWKGEAFILTRHDLEHQALEDGSSVQEISVSRYYNYYLVRTHHFSHYRFLSSPYLYGAPLIQEVWAPNKTMFISPEDELFEKIIESEIPLDASELEKVFYSALEREYVDEMPNIGNFEAPYESSFCFGLTHLNYRHQNTINILQILIAFSKAKPKTNEESVIWGSVHDKLYELPYFDRYSHRHFPIKIDEINTVFSELNTYIVENYLIKNFHPFSSIIFDDFVEGTVYHAEDDNVYSFFDNADFDAYEFNESYSLTL
ncbi:HD domain-containing protein [Sphingobacterium corticibacterium]|uniref:HD-CE domain-containing protein n=1 Tax=Sphingobacterium corticibacterium TaxID=2484746 RepID=A0A4Q6XDM1_9SPHI|nr:ATP-binding protein [Sphingobacterium corticibacterium]RZF57881.1 hypothetical protein EWE74_19615 [Sphingobacterium corticibacterium]